MVILLCSVAGLTLLSWKLLGHISHNSVRSHGPRLNAENADKICPLKLEIAVTSSLEPSDLVTITFDEFLIDPVIRLETAAVPLSTTLLSSPTTESTYTEANNRKHSRKPVVIKLDTEMTLRQDEDEQENTGKLDLPQIRMGTKHAIPFKKDEFKMLYKNFDPSQHNSDVQPPNLNEKAEEDGVKVPFEPPSTRNGRSPKVINLANSPGARMNLTKSSSDVDDNEYSPDEDTEDEWLSEPKARPPVPEYTNEDISAEIFEPGQQFIKEV